MMKKELLSGVALVTEASSGIGKATAIAFAQAGAEVVPAARQIKESEEVVVKKYYRNLYLEWVRNFVGHGVLQSFKLSAMYGYYDSKII